MKPYTPLFAFIFLFVLAIFISVFMAIKTPLLEDKSYFSTKSVVDKNINSILIDQKEFDKKHKVTIGINQSPNIRLYSPYNNKRNILTIPSGNNRIYVNADGSNASFKMYLGSNIAPDKFIGTMESDGRFLYKDINLSKGKYKLTLQAEENGIKAFFEQEIFVR